MPITTRKATKVFRFPGASPGSAGTRPRLFERRMRNGQHFPHIRREQRAEVLNINRDGTAFVPLDHITVPQRLPPVGDASDLYPVPINPLHGWDDGHALPEFSKRKQCVWRAAFKEDFRL